MRMNPDEGVPDADDDDMWERVQKLKELLPAILVEEAKKIPPEALLMKNKHKGSNNYGGLLTGEIEIMRCSWHTDSVSS